MLIVLGRVHVHAHNFDAALALSREHVARSRTEPGCLEHGVSLDADDPYCLVFVERWASTADLEAHFAVPASRSFAKALRGWAVGAPDMKVLRVEA